MSGKSNSGRVPVGSSDLFCVAPLKWRKNARTDWVQSWWATVPMGSYTVERFRDDETREWGGWNLRWCFDEYYDEDSTAVESLAEGKRKAWENWMERLRPALIPQDDL